MDGGRTFVEDAALVFCVASVATLLFQRLRQPAVLGYLVAGLLVGPHLPLSLIANTKRIEELASLGVILVIFSIGLEFRLTKLRRVLPNSGIAALVQIPAMLWLGYCIGRVAGWSDRESFFVGGMICISSTMIVARVLAPPKADPRVAENAFGILIVQDLAAIVLIAVFTAMATDASVPPQRVLVLVVELALFLAVAVVIGVLLVPWVVRESHHQGSAEVLLVAAIGICLGGALLAAYLGFSVALGAFVAGSVIAESGRRKRVAKLVEPVRDVFAALFFVSIGMLVDPHSFAVNWVAIAVIGCAVSGGQIVFATAGSLLAGRSLGVSLRTGMALTQIGEFSFIIVGIGVSSGTLEPRFMAIAVGVAVMTIFSTPLLVGASARAADAVERRLPRPLQTFIPLYAGWLESLRHGTGKTDGPSVRRSGLLVLVDVAAIDAIVVTAAVVRNRLGDWIAVHTPVSSGVAAFAAAAVGLLMAAPFAVSLVKTVRRVAKVLAARALPLTEKGVDLAEAPRQALVTGIEMTVSLVAVVPLIAVTAPFLPLYVGAIVMAVLLATLGVFFWRGASNLQGHVRASAELVLALLERQRRADDTEQAPTSSVLASLLPGLGPLVPCAISPRSAAANSTLAELNLRARTGATVLALCHADGTGVSMPTGHDRLLAGDILTMSGTVAAIESAERIFAAEPS